MAIPFDSCILALLCGSLSYSAQRSLPLTFVPLCLIIIVSMLDRFIPSIPILAASYFIFLGICCFQPLLSIFLPLFIYYLNGTLYRFAILFSILPLILLFNEYPPFTLVFSLLFMLTAYHLSRKNLAIEILSKDYEAFRETARELSQVQEEKNKQILSNQDYEIHTATLKERNRIAKEIHDHVGHLLSRSLLQIGALITVAREEEVREGLFSLKHSLSEGMDSIRSSIHNMHDESIDLEASLEGLTRNFTFCVIQFSYQLTAAPPLEIKYACIAIVKEALANIIKHSNASLVKISAESESESYLLSIQDNGTVSEAVKRRIARCQARREYPEGLGLQSINDRVHSLDGSLEITTDCGFALYIRLPKFRQET